MILHIAKTKLKQDAFKNYVYDAFSEDIDIVSLYPEKTMEEMIKKIEQCNPNILIVENCINNINYLGQELVERYHRLHKAVNCIIIVDYNNIETFIENAEDKIYYIHNYSTLYTETSDLIKKLYHNNY